METTIRQPFNPAQLELLSTMASLNTEADLFELKQALARFFADRADRCETEVPFGHPAASKLTCGCYPHTIDEKVC